MARIVVNKCFGGFGLSDKAVQRILELQGKNVFFYKQIKNKYKDGQDLYEKIEPAETGEAFSSYVFTKDYGQHFSEFPNSEDDGYFYYRDIKRTDPVLIQVIEEMGESAFGFAAKLSIVEIPDDIKWYIDDYDGFETIREEHKSW